MINVLEKNGFNHAGKQIWVFDGVKDASSFKVVVYKKIVVWTVKGLPLSVFKSKSYATHVCYKNSDEAVMNAVKIKDCLLKFILSHNKI